MFKFTTILFLAFLAFTKLEGQGSSAYKSGYKDMIFHDASRPYDSLGAKLLSTVFGPGAGNAAVAIPGLSQRTILTGVWYPVKKNQSCLPHFVKDAYYNNYEAYYIPSNISLLTYFKLKPDVTPTDINTTIANGFENDQIADCSGGPIASGNFPLVLYIPGNGGNRLSNANLASKLAQQGYIVMSAEFSGNPHVSLIPLVDPEFNARNPTLSFLVNNFFPYPVYIQTHSAGEPYGASPSGATVIGVPWVETQAEAVQRVDKYFREAITDITYVYNQAVLMNTDNASPFYQKINSSKVGLLGSSIGANITFAAGESLNFITAKVTLVGAPSLDRFAFPFSSSLPEYTDPNSPTLGPVIPLQALNPAKPTLSFISQQDTAIGSLFPKSPR